MSGIVGSSGQKSAPHCDVGTIAMLGTVRPLVKFSVEVLGAGNCSPSQAVRWPTRSAW